MKFRNLLGIGLSFSILGCATMRSGGKTDQIQSLQAKISELERELEEKDEEIRELEQALMEPRGDSSSETLRSGTAPMTPKSIQTALKNADFYAGPVDGKIGSKTKKAIGEFQRANGLTCDGIVGKKTWQKLQMYLD